MGKRKKLAFLSASTLRKKKTGRSLLFRLLPPDAFAIIADGVYYRFGGKALAALLVALSSDALCETIATNYTAKLAARLSWRATDLGAPLRELRATRDFVVQRLQNVSVHRCLLCGTEGEPGLSLLKLGAWVGNALGVDGDLAACRDCWLKRYPDRLTELPGCQCGGIHFRSRVGCKGCATSMLFGRSWRQPLVLSGDPERALRVYRPLAQLVHYDYGNREDEHWVAARALGWVDLVPLAAQDLSPDATRKEFLRLLRSALDDPSRFSGLTRKTLSILVEEWDTRRTELLVLWG